MFLLDTSVLTRLRVPSIRRRIEELDAAGLARSSMTDLDISASRRVTLTNGTASPLRSEPSGESMSRHITSTVRIRFNATSPPTDSKDARSPISSSPRPPRPPRSRSSTTTRTSTTSPPSPDNQPSGSSSADRSIDRFGHDLPPHRRVGHTARALAGGGRDGLASRRVGVTVDRGQPEHGGDVPQAGPRLLVDCGAATSDDRAGPDDGSRWRPSARPVHLRHRARRSWPPTLPTSWCRHRVPIGADPRGSGEPRPSDAA